MIDIDVLLAWGATYKKIKTGEVIFFEGSSCNFYHQLIEGTVRWVNINDDGKEFIHAIIEPGECFGELPLFDEQPYAASAIADTNALILRLHASTFHQLINERNDIHLSFSQLMAQRIRFRLQIIKELANNDPKHRISFLINHFKKVKRNICPKCNQLKLTRQQIADMTGLRVETVIRTMRYMHEQGSISIRRGKVYC
jgi:CRP-like cAMP-binding protein